VHLIPAADWCGTVARCGDDLAAFFALVRRHIRLNELVVSPDRRLVAVNFSDQPVDFSPWPAAAWRVEVASDGAGEGEPYRGSLGASTAVVLAPLR